MKEVIMKVPSFSADYPKAPIYVADLVRCRECAKWLGSSGICMWDKGTSLFTKSDDFCSYGERREP